MLAGTLHAMPDHSELEIEAPLVLENESEAAGNRMPILLSSVVVQRPVAAEEVRSADAQSAALEM